VPVPWVQRLVEAARNLIVLDHLATPTVGHAHMVLPVGSFADAAGTLVNCEGRAQRFYSLQPPSDDVDAGWRWLRDLAAGAGHARAAGWQTVDDVAAAIAATLPVFEALPETAPAAGFRMTGGKIPRQSHRFSGRTAMHAHLDVHEPKPDADPDSPLAFSMEGHDGAPPAALIARYWAPGWNSVQALNKFQSEIPGPLQGAEPGARLLDEFEPTAAAYFTEIPQRDHLPENKWWLVAVSYVFGSDELSVHCPGIARRSPGPCVLLHPEDAAALGIGAGDPVTVSLDDHRVDLPVRLDPGLARKVAGLPAGLPGMPVWELPAAVTLGKGVRR
jgi:NADH-quinone oxidoreductase subunit G